MTKRVNIAKAYVFVVNALRSTLWHFALAALNAALAVLTPLVLNTGPAPDVSGAGSGTPLWRMQAANAARARRKAALKWGALLCLGGALDEPACAEAVDVWEVLAASVVAVAVPAVVDVAAATVVVAVLPAAVPVEELPPQALRPRRQASTTINAAAGGACIWMLGV